MNGAPLPHRGIPLGPQVPKRPRSAQPAPSGAADKEMQGLDGSASLNLLVPLPKTKAHPGLSRPPRARPLWGAAAPEVLFIAGSAPARGWGGAHGNLPLLELKGRTSAIGVIAKPLGPRSLRPCPACTHLATSRATCGRALCVLAGPPSPSPGRAEADEGQAPRSSRAPPPARHRVPEKSGRWKVSVANGGRRALQRRRGGGAGGLSLLSVETGGAGLGAAAAGEGGTAGGTNTAK